MRESEQDKLIIAAASQLGHRLFKCRRADAWVGQIVSKSPGLITLRNPMPLKAGLVDGNSDLIGWTSDGRFLAIEDKVGRNKPTRQQLAFVNAVNKAGGVGGVVWSVKEAIKLMNF